MPPVPLRSTPLRALSLAVATTLVACGCGEDKNPVTGDPGAASRKVAEANAALAVVLSDLINSPTDPQRPSDLDFRTPDRLYREALGLDPSNPDAHFGVGVLGLATLTTAAEVNAAFDEWKAYLDAHVPFEVPSSPLAPLGVRITPAAGAGALKLPFQVVPLSVLAQARPNRTLSDPQISRVQGILENLVLPKLAEAITHLGTVAQNPNYRFVVTPQMQGDPDATPAEIDRTDILALRAASGLLAAACHVAVSYELGFAAYDSASLHQALQPGSGWLALRLSGASHMGSARTSVLGAVNDLDAAITSLLGEQDSQDDDVIKIGPDGIARAEAESIRVNLPNVVDAMNNGVSLLGDWDNDIATPDFPLTVRPGALFTSPVPDWKAKLPAYTARVERRPLNSYYAFNSGTQPAIVTVSDTGYYSGYYNLYVRPGQYDDYYYGDPALQSAVTQVVQERLTLAAATPNWTGEFSGYGNFYGLVNPGGQTILVSWFESVGIAGTQVGVPVLAWVAQSFDTWTWPDPTMGGLLPQMSSTAALMNTFGVDASDWQPEWVLDWTGLVP